LSRGRPSPNKSSSRNRRSPGKSPVCPTRPALTTLQSNLSPYILLEMVSFSNCPDVTVGSRQTGSGHRTRLE
jgi:hypothetical protein